MIRVVKVNKIRGKDRDSVCYCGRVFSGWPELKMTKCGLSAP